MTKRRPSWSERLWQVAALLCGLLLLNVSSALAATTGHQASAKKVEVAARPAVRHAGKKPVRTTTRGTRTLGRNNLRQRGEAAEPEVLTAEIKDDETIGLHGAASFYAYGFHGRRTATGEVFKVKDFTAASNHFPLGTMVAVRRLDNNLCAIVKVNDRMHAKHRKRIIDVSRGVAEYLDMIRAGVVLVRVAKLHKDWQDQGLGACHAAFEPETACPSCGQAPRLPGIVGEPGN